MANGNDKYPFAESIILTCLTLVLLAFTTSSILFLAHYFLDLPLGSNPPALMLAISVCFWLAYQLCIADAPECSIFSENLYTAA